VSPQNSFQKGFLWGGPDLAPGRSRKRWRGLKESHVKPRRAIETLSSRDRARLRGLAHDLKPTVHIGKEGVTDATARSLEQAFNTRELIKLKVLEASATSPKDVADNFARRIDRVHVIQIIGRTIVLYRQPVQQQSPAPGSRPRH
jgi:RNA-binding protein